MSEITLYPIINTDNPVSGDGTSADPIDLDVSATGGNVLTVNPDGAYVPTDSLSTYGTPAGGQTHTAADGTTQEIQILSQDAGNILSAGADNGNYLAATDITGQINTANPISGDGSAGSPIDLDVSATANNSVTINGDGIYVSEHYSDNVALASSGDSGGASIDSVGSVTAITGGTITINNPSSSRALSVLFVGGGAIASTLQTVGVWDIILDQNINGGGFANYGSKRYGPYPSGPIGVTMDVYADYTATIVAGGSLTIQRRLVVTTVTGSTGSTIGVNSIDLRGIWATE